MLNHISGRSSQKSGTFLLLRRRGVGPAGEWESLEEEGVDEEVDVTPAMAADAAAEAAAAAAVPITFSNHSGVKGFNGGWLGMFGGGVTSETLPATEILS